MEVILSAVDKELVDAWQSICSGLDCVSIHQGSIFEVPCDAVVSPANSFGFMDGGIDALYSRHFGWHIQDRLQQLIRERHHGELLVGIAEIVETGDKQTPFVVAAPTMRVPTILVDSVNPYLAARAALLLIKHGRFPTGDRVGMPISEAVRTVAFPGLGTGVGRVSPATCAKQIHAAINEVVGGEAEFPPSWAHAQIRHQELYSDEVRDLQIDR